MARFRKRMDVMSTAHEMIPVAIRPTGSDDDNESGIDGKYGPKAGFGETMGKMMLRNKNQHFALYMMMGAVVLITFAATSPPHSSGGAIAQPNSPKMDQEKMQPSESRMLLNDTDVNPVGTCISDPDVMPRSWRAPENVLFPDPGGPWTDEEEALCLEAKYKGFNELLTFYDELPEPRIIKLGTDAVNSLIDYVYGSQHIPDWRRRAFHQTSRVIKIVAEANFDRWDSWSENECGGMEMKMKFAGYAQYLSNMLHAEKELLGEDEGLLELRDKIVDMLQQSFDDCDDGLESEELLGPNYKGRLLDYSLRTDEVWEWMIQSIAYTECLTIPDLKLPEGTDDYIADVWEYFQNYRIPNADGFYERKWDVGRTEDGQWDQAGYLATHLPYLSTGFGRHFAYVKDAPDLFHYFRENYYAAINTGSHDLVAEFVDSLRAYGCTEETDIQVRHGTRYMLSLYKAAGHSFVNHRDENEDDQPNDYSIMHKPWTGIASVETTRTFEPYSPGSYGYAFRQVLKHHGQGSLSNAMEGTEY